MKNWQQILRENDPGSERMDADAAARMRAIVLSTAREAPSKASWRMRVALAAFACLVMMLSTIATRRPIEVGRDGVAPEPPSERRQIQFATPGGTRIIWELNPEFRLTETLP